MQGQITCSRKDEGLRWERGLCFIYGPTLPPSARPHGRSSALCPLPFFPHHLAPSSSVVAPSSIAMLAAGPSGTMNLLFPPLLPHVECDSILSPLDSLARPLLLRSWPGLAWLLHRSLLVLPAACPLTDRVLLISLPRLLQCPDHKGPALDRRWPVAVRVHLPNKDQLPPPARAAPYPPPPGKCSTDRFPYSLSLPSSACLSG